MPSQAKPKDFHEFQQNLKDLESQIHKLLEASEDGPSKKTKDLTGKVFKLADRAKQTQPRDAWSRAITNQTTLEKIPQQFNDDFGRFKGLVDFVERVRREHYNATGHNIGRTYGAFGASELSQRHRHGKFAIDTLEIRCDACGDESPRSKRRDYPIHILLHDRGQWEVCTGQSDCECRGYEGKGVRIGVNLSTERPGKTKG
jgi:hypothetical protein